MTRVSVVVNNYNYERYLAEAVDSALAQDWPDVETIVVDDGSTDASRDVLAGYGPDVVLVLQPNRGQIAACTAGLAASSGDVVLFLDADDVLAVPAARTAVHGFAAAPEAVRVSWPLCEVDAMGRPTGRLRPPEPLDGGDLRRRVLDQGPDSYVSAPTSGNAWTRRFLTQVLPAQDEELRLGIDRYLSDLAPLFGTVTVVEEPHSFYRVHGENSYWRSSLEHRVTWLRGSAPCPPCGCGWAAPPT
jgi:cellulose synthase/poly-beta-1,6-N-acetylglucosamine synthase-like glycosyltransferase